MSDKNYAPVCGIYCGHCDFLGKQCEGCGYVDGKPFWTAQIPSGVCPLHDCCRNHKQMEHCGLCDKFPCETFTSLRDPAMDDEEAEHSLRMRQNDLLLRKEIGTEAWLKERR